MERRMKERREQLKNGKVLSTKVISETLDTPASFQSDTRRIEEFKSVFSRNIYRYEN